MKSRIAIHVLAAAALAAAPVAARNLTYRTHHTVVMAGQVPAYEFTTLTELTKSRHKNTYLIRSAAGERFVITRTTEFAKGFESFEFLDLATRKSLRSRWLFDVKAGDSAAWAKKLKTVKAGDGPLWRFEADGRSVEFRHDEAVDRSWNGKLRSELASVVDHSLRVKLESMRALFALPTFFSACRYLAPLWDSDPCPQTTGLALRTTGPACDFDAKFGYRCTPQQAAAIDAAIKSGTSPKTY